MIVLVMGLPGAGKTHLAVRLQTILGFAWYNADTMRKAANDWDFSTAGRVRQANRMNNVARFEDMYGRNVVCDFVCPTEETRNLFHADCVIWLDTIDSSRFEDTNKVFEPPKEVDYHIKNLFTDEEIEYLCEDIKLKYNV